MRNVVKIMATVVAVSVVVLIAAFAWARPGSVEVPALPVASPVTPAPSENPAVEVSPFADPAGVPPAPAGPPPKARSSAGGSISSGPSSRSSSGGGSVEADSGDQYPDLPAGSNLSGPGHSSVTGGSGQDGADPDRGFDGEGASGSGRNASAGGESGQDGDKGRDRKDERKRDD